MNPALISAGATIGSSLIGAGATQGQNIASQKWQRYMYDLQREHRIEEWNMQNAYNHPSAQMARFKEAGLNPFLIYGQQNEGATLQPTKVGNPQFNTPDFTGIPKGIAAYYDIQMRQAQVDNLRDRNTVLKEEAALKNAQRLNILSGTERLDFDLGLDKTTYDISLDARREKLRKLKVESDYLLSKNERELFMTTNIFRPL